MSSLKSSLNVLAALALAAATLPCDAQSSGSDLQLDIVPESALLNGHAQSSGGAARVDSSSERNFFGTSRTTTGWLGSAVQLEAPTSTGTGQYTKPKVRIGLPSDSMRNFLNSAGLPAEKCQLPMLRARTKSNGDGDINGTLWLYARCTFR